MSRKLLCSSLVVAIVVLVTVLFKTLPCNRNRHSTGESIGAAISEEQFIRVTAQLYALWAEGKVYRKGKHADKALEMGLFEVPDTAEAAEVLKPFGLTRKQFSDEYYRRMYGPDPSHPNRNQPLFDEVVAEFHRLASRQ